MGQQPRPNNIMLFIYVLLAFSLVACGPGIPLTSVQKVIKQSLADDESQTVTLSDPNHSYVNSGIGSVEFTVTLTHQLNSSLTRSNIQLLKTGSADGEIVVSGGGTQFTITLGPLTGNGTLSLSVVIGSTTYAFTNKSVTVDNQAPLQTTNITTPSTLVTSGSAEISWDSVSDSSTVSYQLKVCSDTDCSSGCSAVVESSITTAVVEGLGNSTYYACVQTVDLAGNLSGFKASTSSFTANSTPLTLEVSMVALVSPTNGSSSSNNTPHFTGSGITAAATLTLYSDSGCSSELASGVVGGDGTLSINTPAITSDGTIHFYGKLTKGLQTSTCIDLEKAYLLDTTPPVLSELSSPSLSSPNNGTTSSDKTPVIGGSGPNGVMVAIYDSSGCTTPTLKGSATITGGNFLINSISYSDITDDGNKHFYVQLSDPLGNTSSCMDLSLSYQLDTTPPTDPTAWSLTNITSGTTSTISTPQITGSGLASENGSYAVIYNSVNCTTPVGSATISGGSFTVNNITYPSNGSADGAKTFYGKLIDFAGNSSACVALNLNYQLDTVTPTNPTGWTLTTPSNGTTSNNTTPSLSGGGLASENGSFIFIYNNVACITAVGTATISGGSFTVSNISYANDGSADGSKTFYGKIVDNVNHSSSCVALNLSYYLDTIPPADPTGWSLSSPSAGVTSKDTTPAIDGVGLDRENGGLVKIYENSSCTGSASGSATITSGAFTVSNISFLSNGTHDGTFAFYGLITDVAGNVSNCVNLNLGYLLDTTPPNNPSGWGLSSPNNGTTSGDFTPQIAKAGLVSEDGSVVTIYDNIGCSSSIGSATINAGSFTVFNISYPNDGSEDGTKTFYGKITDVAGNGTSCVALALGYLLDTTVPSSPSGWSLASPSNGATSKDNTPQISGSGLNAENSSYVVIYDDVSCAAAIGTATISGGSFTVSNISYATNGTQDGTKTFYGKIVDISANSSNCVSLGLSYLYDHTNPSDPSSWTMASPNSGTTSNDVTPQISGAALNSEEGGTIQIYATIACGSAIGSATISGGSFTVSNISYLANGTQDGTKSYFGKIIDVAGNSSNCVDLSLGYLVDTTAPSNPSGWSLSSPTNGTTSNNITPQIGKAGLAAENSSLITIYDNIACASAIGSATIAAGSFTVSNITYLNNGTQDGTKSFYGKITDSGGNSSSCVNLSLGYLLDTTAPANPSGWTMSSPNVNITSSDATPQISGAGLAAENGGTATIYDNIACAVPVGSAGIAEGTFTVTNISYLTDGSMEGVKNFYGKLTDVGGNDSNCVNLNLSYKLDTIAPLDPSGWSLVNVTSGNTSGDFTPQIGGSGLAAENKSIVKIYLDNCSGSIIGSATISGGNFTVTNIAFASSGADDGLKTFFATITDMAANVSNCTDLSLNYTLDTSIPSVTISVPTAADFINDTTKAAFAVAGGCSEAGRTVTVGATGGLSATPVCAGNHSWTTTLDFSAVANGAVTITADHDNVGGNPAPQATVTLTKDAAAPADPTGWTVASPNSGTTSSDYTPQISGNGLVAENGATITIYSAGACLTPVGTAEVAGGVFTVSNITFASNGSADGTKAFYGKITDVAGNDSTCVDLSLSYKLDTTNPANPSGWTMASPNSGMTSNDVTPQISGAGLAAENSSTITIYDASGCAAAIGTATIAAATFTVSNITYLANGTQDGTKAFYGKIVDAAGNSSACVSLNLGYKLDTISPADPTGWTIASPNSGLTSSDNTPQISGAGLASENSSTINIYDAIACAVSIGSATIAGGSYTVSNISYLTNGTQDGTKTFYGKISDVAGNDSNCVNLSLGYLFDTTAPANPSGWTMASPNSGVTSNDNTPQINGNGLAAENGGVVNIYPTGACGSSIGSATIAAGSFTVANITYLNNGTQDGTKAFFGTITDIAGNSSACTNLNLGYLLDTTAPSNPSGWTMVSPNIATTSNDTTPQISGSGLGGENGSFIVIYDASGCAVPMGTATIAAGSFTVSNISYAANGTDDGTKAFYGKISDLAGNSSSCISLSLGYLLDTTAPANPSGWSMSSPNSATTSNDYTPQISGSGLAAENGSTLVISNANDCSSPVGSATISGGVFTVSNITYAANGSDDGTKTFYGKITDSANNGSVCTNLNLSYLLDTTAPADPSGWSMASPNSGTTSTDTTPQISKGGLAAENGSFVTIYDAGACASPIGSATIAGGSFTISNISYASNGMQDGTKAFYGKIVDLAGNSSNCVSLNLGYLLDTTAPANPSGWTMASPNSGTTSSDNTPQISGSGLASENGSTVIISNVAGCGSSIGSATISNGSFTVTNISYATDGSADGTKTFYGKITDSVNNASSCTNLSLSYLYDRTAPTVSITAPLSSDLIVPATMSSVTVSGSCSENGRTVTINATGGLSATPTCNSGSYTTNINFSSVAEGAVTITADLSDVTGNSATTASVSLFKLTRAVARFIASGFYGSCAILGDGTSKCWGINSKGQLGLGSTVQMGDNPNEMGNNLSTINLGTGRSAQSLSLSYYHTCALLDNSAVKCWGWNSSGQLGQGTAIDLGDNADEMGDNLSAILLGTGRLAIAVSSVGTHSCALLDDMSVKCWGLNTSGQLGQGHATALGDNPNEMGDNLSKILLGNGRKAMQIATGSYTSCAILDDSTLKCWGDGTYGKLGQGNVNILGNNPNEMGDNLSTIQLGTNLTALAVTSHQYGICALLNDSSIKCWGGNGAGQVGLGHTSNIGDNANEMGDNLSAILLGTNRKALAIAMGNHSCAILDDRTLKCWGSNTHGELGLGNLTSMGDNADEMGDNLSTINVGSNRRVIAVSATYNGTCALLDNSTVKCWGEDNTGQSGLGTAAVYGDGANEMGDNLSAITFGTPVRIVKAVSAGEGFSCALLDDSSVKCWGKGAEGRTGQGSENNIGSVSGEMGASLSSVLLGNGRKALTLSNGTNHSCALLDNSQIRCWGYGLKGRLGQGSAISKGDNPDEMGDNLTYVNLGTGHFAIKVSVSDAHSCALLDDGTVKCWGDSSSGQLGQGNTTTLGSALNDMGDNLSAIILSSTEKAINISVNLNSSCALLTNGKLKCWGSASNGKLGQGNTIAKGDDPNEMGDNLSVILLGTNRLVYSLPSSNTGNHMCAILDDSSLKCWGDNSYGQLGQGHTQDLGDNADEMGDNLSSVNLGHKVIKISIGLYSNCALLDNNTLKCWGRNQSGQLGQGDVATRGNAADEMGNNLSTVNIGSNRTISDVAVSSNGLHVCTLLSNGSIKCWGDGSTGGLGQGNANNLGDDPNEMGDNLSTINWWN